MDPMDEDTRSSSGRLGSESGPSGSASGAGQGNTPTSGLGPSNSAQAQVNKRRRGLGVVTPNACTECRKKRAKVRRQNIPHTVSLIFLAQRSSMLTTTPLSCL